MEFKETIHIIKSSAETNGEYILADCKGTPDASTLPHYHKIISQTFEVIKGTVFLKVNDVVHVLHKGDVYTVKPGEKHVVYNETDRTARFMMTVRPGHKGYEEFMKLTYIRSAETVSEEEKQKIYLNADTYISES
jgi:quercetin dioxygenase-like cupin family protein